VAETKKFRAIRGVRDILPPETALWNWFEQTARSVLETYNFHEIRLPIFEQTELFARSVGTDTDLVSKEMYSLADRPHEELDFARKFALAHERQLAPGYPFGLERFLQVVEAFAATARAAFSADRALASEGNRKALLEVEQAAAKMRPLLGRYGSVVHEDEFRDHATQIVFSLQGFDLGKLLTLRPEATASVVRAYIEHGMHTWPQPVKLYYFGPMFRRERPQKGRYRQFYQIGAEVLGPSDAPAIDAEVIEMLMVFFGRVGLKKTTLLINSIGCRDCRPKYAELLRAALEKVRDRLGPDSQRRIATNPLRVLDSKLEEEQAVIENLPPISDHLCAACREHFRKLTAELKLRRIEYTENWRLVRGLDYYTRTTFEVTAAGLGAQDAVCGGGRYDGLVELLGGPAGIKGIGFSIGSDRAILSIQETGRAPAARALDAFVAWLGEEAYAAAVALAARLRDEGCSVELPPEELKLKKALSLAEKLRARYAVIIGEDELRSKRFTVKRLADRTQQKLTEAELELLLKQAGAAPGKTEG